MNQDISPDSDDSPDDDASFCDPEREKKLADAVQECRELQRSGWVWQGGDPRSHCLCHPDDPEISMWFDPYTGEQLLSPKLAERLKNSIQRNQRNQSA